VNLDEYFEGAAGLKSGTQKPSSRRIGKKDKVFSDGVSKRFLGRKIVKPPCTHLTDVDDQGGALRTAGISARDAGKARSRHITEAPTTISTIKDIMCDLPPDRAEFYRQRYSAMYKGASGIRLEYDAFGDKYDSFGGKSPRSEGEANFVESAAGNMKKTFEGRGKCKNVPMAKTYAKRTMYGRRSISKEDTMHDKNFYSFSRDAAGKAKSCTGSNSSLRTFDRNSGSAVRSNIELAHAR